MGKKKHSRVNSVCACLHEGDIIWDKFERIRAELEATTFLPVTNAHVLRLSVLKLHDDIFGAEEPESE